MSVTQYQNNVNKLDKEISDLEKKKAGVDSEVAKIDDSIAKNSKYILTHSSSSSASSKQRENERLMRNKIQKQKESADLMKKIADKRNKRNSEYIKFQKEQVFLISFFMKYSHNDFFRMKRLRKAIKRCIYAF